MLSRRHVRAKVLQALYAYKLSGNHELHIGEKEFLHSIEKVFDMFYYQISLVLKIRDFAEIQSQDAKFKRIPTDQDLNPNMKFLNNALLQYLSENESLNRIIEKRKTNWDNDSNIPKNIFRKFKISSVYQSYMSEQANSFEHDKAIILKLIKKFVYTHRPLFDHYEDNSIYWTFDFDYTTFILIKIIQDLKEEDVYVFSDSSSDDLKEVVGFGKDLFRKTIIDDSNYSEMIATYTENWEIERIALIDGLIMKMAICELYQFSSIPVKVTLNEYIELSKSFSTPKSNVFINGILDKIVEESKNSKKILKTGRGLI